MLRVKENQFVIFVWEINGDFEFYLNFVWSCRVDEDDDDDALFNTFIFN